MSPTLMLIAAVGRNGVIGVGGVLPWRLPSDMRLFKRVTMGRPLIMGRKTFESLGRALPGRTNIVITHRREYEAPGATVVHSFDEALEAACTVATADGVGEIFVIGGGEIYRAAFDKADRLMITHVDAAPEGDVTFPEIDPDAWEGRELADIERSDKDTHSYQVRAYVRQRSRSPH